MAAASTTTEARQHQAALLLAHGLTITRVASEIGCCTRTIYDWTRNSRNFQAEFERAKRTVRRELQKQMRCATEAAIASVVQSIRTASKPKRVRLAFNVVDAASAPQTDEIRTMIQEQIIEHEQSQRLAMTKAEV